MAYHPPWINVCALEFQIQPTYHLVTWKQASGWPTITLQTVQPLPWTPLIKVYGTLTFTNVGSQFNNTVSYWLSHLSVQKSITGCPISEKRRTCLLHVTFSPHKRWPSDAQRYIPELKVISTVFKIIMVRLNWVARGGAVGCGTALQPEGRGFDSRGNHWNFSLT